MNQPAKTFDGLGIAPNLLTQLDRLKFSVPTPIQSKAIPVAISGKDMIGIAQTGTGKTLAFGVPLIQRLESLPPTAQGLILLPTRELAEQVQLSLKKLVPNLTLALVIGGASARQQTAMLRRHPKIIIATPGRLIDLMQSGIVSLKNIAILILDEADRMLDMGFAPQINKIIITTPQKKQVLLFSATMPPEIARLAMRYMQLPLRVEVAPAGTASELVEQEIFVVSHETRPQLLDKILAEYYGSILIFSRTKHGARKLARVVRNMGHTAEEIHSNRSLSQRRNALAGFKSGKYRILVATDVAARGIDVVGIELVVNYDLPENPNDYLHRIGRTGRANHVGKAISLATPSQASKINAIERAIRTRLPITKTPVDLPPKRVLAKQHLANKKTPPFKNRFRGFKHKN
ncbi:MAG: DEAD/DEAH box helicase [Patescibacteria group bacterium]